VDDATRSRMSHLSAAKGEWEDGVLAKALSLFPERKENFETLSGI
jgi:hypothetical protein